MSTTAASSQRPGVMARLMVAIPPEPPAEPFRYSTQLVVYVVALCVLSIALAVPTVRAPSNVAVLVLGGVAIFAIDRVRVRSFGGVRAPWSPSAFVQLAVSFAFGSVGALTAALVSTLAVAIRFRIGWFRAALNAAGFFLVNLAAWFVYHTLAVASSSNLWLTACAGIAGGAASYVVNSAVLCGVIPPTQDVSIRAFLRSTLGVVPNDLLYGLGAAGFSTFFAKGGAAYLVMWLAPVVSNQGFLVILARRTNEYVAERVELLRRIISAADDERARIASDLHDGPVAEFAGLTMQLGSIIEQLPSEIRPKVNEVIDGMTTANGNLRRGISELSPTDLDKPGRLRTEITEKLLAPLVESGIDVDASIPDVVPLARGGLELLHRVCVEALRNVQRHAHPKHVAVTVTVAGAGVALVIDDDGRGFSADDLARARANDHFGVRLLREKVEAAGGTFELESKPGAGAHLRVKLPVAVDAPE
jgi:signal transduction histidine kinase